MKKVNKVLIGLLISIMATSAYAVKIEVMPTVGKAFKASDDRLEDDEILYGVRGTVFLNDEVGVQASYEASTSNKVGTAAQKAAGHETDIERVSANIVYEKNTGKRIRPYATVGIGNESTHGLVAPAGNDGSQGFIQAGGGLKFGLTKNVDLVTEAKWIRKLSNNDDDIVATVGLGINTGSSSSSAAKVAARVPSVTETSDVQNAINLAEFRKMTTTKTTAPVVQESVSTVAPVIVESATVIDSEIPANAIILDEDATIDIASSEMIVEDEVVETMPESESGYYVQMAALFKGKGEPITNRLEQKDYHYVLHNVEKHGKEATLVLVGPYETKMEASVAKKYLKRLKGDAFIYHMN